MTSPTRSDVNRRRGSRFPSAPHRKRGRRGDQLTLAAAYRDSLYVIRSQRGIDYGENLDPVIQEAEDLSQPLGVVWTNGLQAYREVERDHRAVVHKERYVSPDGVHINQDECLFSLVHRGSGSSAARRTNGDRGSGGATSTSTIRCCGCTGKLRSGSSRRC